MPRAGVERARSTRLAPQVVMVVAARASSASSSTSAASAASAAAAASSASSAAAAAAAVAAAAAAAGPDEEGGGAITAECRDDDDYSSSSWLLSRATRTVRARRPLSFRPAVSWATADERRRSEEEGVVAEVVDPSIHVILCPHIRIVVSRRNADVTVVRVAALCRRPAEGAPPPATTK